MRRGQPTSRPRAERTLDPVASSPRSSLRPPPTSPTRARLRETASALRGFLALARGGPGRLEQVEERARRDRGRQAEVRRPPRRADRACRAGAEELAAIEAGRDPLSAAAREPRPLPKALGRRWHAARARPGPRAAGRVRRAVHAALASLAMGGGELRVELHERDRPERDRRRRLPRPPERGHAAGARRDDRFGRRAVADRARAPSGCPRACRRADRRLRRDRRRHRRRDGPCRRRRAPAARGAGPGDHDHPSSADRERRRPPFPRRKGPGDPTHTRIERLSDDDRREELERMLGGREFRRPSR